MTKKNKYFSLLIALLLTFLVASLLVVITRYIQFSPTSLSFLDSNAEINTDEVKFKKISLNEIPLNCINAVISTEDKTFYKNIGVDFNGTIRLTLSVLTNKDFGGGSTISQQVIKLGEKDFFNRDSEDKISEIIYSIKLNQVWSKNKILETYLNNAYFGGFNYGIEAASENFFNKKVNDLDLAECAFLAGLPQLPEVYNPYSDLSAGLERQKVVLDLMNKNNKITLEQEMNARNEILTFK